MLGILNTKSPMQSIPPPTPEAQRPSNMQRRNGIIKGSSNRKKKYENVSRGIHASKSFQCHQAGKDTKIMENQYPDPRRRWIQVRTRRSKIHASEFVTEDQWYRY